MATISSYSCGCIIKEHWTEDGYYTAICEKHLIEQTEIIERHIKKWQDRLAKLRAAPKVGQGKGDGR